MREFVGTDELKGASIRDADLSGARLRSVNFSNVTITDAWLFDSDISGDIRGLKINGVSVEPLIDAELDRRHPERLQLRPTDVAALRAAFDVVDEMWAPTLQRAAALSSDRLHERVDGEYSFVETQRHLLFATNAWLVRMVLRDPHAYHRWDVHPDLPPDAAPDSGPDLEDVLEVRAERQARIRAWLGDASDSDLSTIVTPPDPTGHPQGPHSILTCFQVVLNEEWWHHRYAVRDLAILESRRT
jgi:DinB superfamily/Pentapeptide repeats (8 copies)